MLIKPKTVDSVMSVFTNTIDNLKQISAAKNAEANRIEEQLANLETKQAAALNEADRANLFVKKLEAILA